MRRYICFVSVFALVIALCAAEVYARESRSARPKNLNRLIDERVLIVYLNNFTSETDKISADQFKDELKKFLQARIKERFEVTDKKETAEVYIDAKVNKYQYLEKDPVDQVSGGWSGLLVDAAVDQNYARIDVNMSIVRVKDNKTLWEKDFYSTVTRSNMPEADSIPRVIEQCCKQFVFMCFGKSKR